MNKKDEIFLKFELSKLLYNIIKYLNEYKLDKLVKLDNPFEDLKDYFYIITKNKNIYNKIIDDFSEKYLKEKKIINKKNIIKKSLNKILISIKADTKNIQESNINFDTPLVKKLEYFYNALKLQKNERVLIKISIISYVYDLEYIYGILENENFISNFKALSYFSGLSKYNLLNILSPESILTASKLFYYNPKNSPFEIFQIDFDFANIFMNPKIAAEQIFEKMFNTENKKGLSIDNFYYLEKEKDIISSIITESIKNKKKGINILFYGKPGTGKTEFAGSLLNSLSIKPITIDSSNENRLNVYKLCLQVYEAAENSCIIFDETDNILSTITEDDEIYKNKSNIIKLLEENKIPCIWIVNHVYGIHKAVKRRFSYSLHFKKMPKKILEKVSLRKIRNKKLPMQLYTNYLKNNLQKNDYSIGQISLAIERTNEIYKSQKYSNNELENIFDSILKKMNLLENHGYEKKKNFIYSDNYNLNLLNIDIKPEKIISSIEKYYKLKNKELIFDIKNINFLFHGPPGSGKSELAKYISIKLNKNLIIKRASDLLDMYVGNTEKNIREAFGEAEETESILLIDEADSFFLNRENAVKSWEITQVNEILCAMENYEGVLICTTNFIDNFDTASLRRFSHKIKFGYLNEKQIYSAFIKIFNPIDKNFNNEKFLNEISKINNLTIGDFKTVYRQIIFDPDLTENKIIKLLKKETDLKNNKNISVGF